MQHAFTVEGRNLVVTLGSEIDHHQVSLIFEELEKQSQLHLTKNIIFDFGQVIFMDSAGIGLVMGAYKRTASVGGCTMVCNVSSKVDRVLRMSGVYRFVRIMEL